MKGMKKAALVGIALAAMAFAGAGSASATTLELSGQTVNSEVKITTSLKTGTSSLTEDTSGFSENTCKKSTVNKHTTVFTGTAVTGPVDSMSFSECDRTVTVHASGQTEITYEGGTNGTVYWENGHITEGSPFGHLTCTTGTTHIGTLVGVASGHATLIINAIINCEGISMKWTAEYTVTNPTGLGVSK